MCGIREFERGEDLGDGGLGFEAVVSNAGGRWRLGFRVEVMSV